MRTQLKPGLLLLSIDCRKPEWRIRRYVGNCVDTFDLELPAGTTSYGAKSLIEKIRVTGSID
jgi:hypothetical protein